MGPSAADRTPTREGRSVDLGCAGITPDPDRTPDGLPVREAVQDSRLRRAQARHRMAHTNATTPSPQAPQRAVLAVTGRYRPLHFSAGRRGVGIRQRSQRMQSVFGSDTGAAGQQRAPIDDRPPGQALRPIVRISPGRSDGWPCCRPVLDDATPTCQRTGDEQPVMAADYPRGDGLGAASRVRATPPFPGNREGGPLNGTPMNADGLETDNR